MKRHDILKVFSTERAAAEAIGSSQPSVSRWLLTDKIPIDWEVKLVLASEGELKLSRKAAGALKKRIEQDSRALELSAA